VALKAQMGWDTVDELLCKFYNWKVVTDATFGKAPETYRSKYNKTARYKQGEAFYTLGYGL
jgi:hypothetical protein